MNRASRRSAPASPDGVDRRAVTDAWRRVAGDRTALDDDQWDLLRRAWGSGICRPTGALVGDLMRRLVTPSPPPGIVAALARTGIDMDPWCDAARAVLDRPVVSGGTPYLRAAYVTAMRDLLSIEPPPADVPDILLDAAGALAAAVDRAGGRFAGLDDAHVVDPLVDALLARVPPSTGARRGRMLAIMTDSPLFERHLLRAFAACSG